jgi:hypothetical protein
VKIRAGSIRQSRGAFLAGTAVALLLFVLDFDVVVDAYLRHASAAIGATIALIAGIGIAALARSRLGSLGLALTALATTGTLVAISGIVTGSLDDAAGLGPSAVAPSLFASLTIVAGLIAALAAVAGGLRNRPATIVAAVLAAYAISTIAVPPALQTGGYDAALALPPFLPAWLRGAFLGTFVVLLLGVVAAVVAAVRSKPYRPAALASCVAFTAILQATLYDAAVQGVPTPIAFERPPHAVPAQRDAIAVLAQFVPPENATTTTATAAQGQTSVIAGIGDTPAPTAQPAAPTAPPVDRFEAGIAAGRAALAKGDVSLAALAKMMPNDPAALDRMVRDRVALDIYPGSMRGAAGTLLARAGNDEDRAALLAVLLTAKGMTVRFARSALADAEIAELSARAKADRPDLEASPPDTVALGAGGFDKRSAELNARASASAALAALRGDLDRSRSIAGGLLDAAAAAGHPANGNPETSWPQTLRSHTWVQVTSPGGSWTDLDPSLARLEPGSHLGSAVTTLSALPASDAWQAAVRLVEDAGAGPQTLVTASAPVANLIGGYVVARMVPVGAEDPAKFENAASFRPEIVGALSAQGTPLDLTTLAAARALRLEIDVTAPGGEVTTYRRTLTGPLPAEPTARAAAAAQQVALIITPGAYNETFLMSRWLAAVHAVRPQIAKLAGYSGPLASPIAKDASLYPYSLAELAARDDAASLALSGDSARMWRDRPGIYLERSHVVLDGPVRRMVRAFDIVEDGMTAAGPGASLLNATRGVYVTHAEQTLDSPSLRVGMLQVADSAKSAGAKLAVLASPTDRSKIPAIDAAAIDNLDETFAHHQIALSYDKPSNVDGSSAYGWWTLDGNGNVVGRLTGGGGQEEEEESILIAEVPEQIMNGWDVNQITGSCFGDGATTTSCGGELCDTITGGSVEGAMGAGLNAANKKFFGQAINGQMTLENQMVGKIGGEIATSNTSGNLCGAAYGAAFGPAQSLAF